MYLLTYLLTYICVYVCPPISSLLGLPCITFSSLLNSVTSRRPSSLTSKLRVRRHPRSKDITSHLCLHFVPHSPVVLVGYRRVLGLTTGVDVSLKSRPLPDSETQRLVKSPLRTPGCLSRLKALHLQMFSVSRVSTPSPRESPTPLKTQQPGLSLNVSCRLKRRRTGDFFMFYS